MLVYGIFHNLNFPNLVLTAMKTRAFFSGLIFALVAAWASIVGANTTATPTTIPGRCSASTSARAAQCGQRVNGVGQGGQSGVGDVDAPDPVGARHKPLPRAAGRGKAGAAEVPCRSAAPSAMPAIPSILGRIQIYNDYGLGYMLRPVLYDAKSGVVRDAERLDQDEIGAGGLRQQAGISWRRKLGRRGLIVFRRRGTTFYPQHTDLRGE